MRHNKSRRTHWFHGHPIVSKRKWETQSRCPELSAYCISEPIDRMLISAICMGALSYRSCHCIHVSSIFRAAVAETLTRHRLQWCNEVQWAGNYSTLPWSSNIRPRVITMRCQSWGRMGGWGGNGHECYIKGVIKNEFARLETQEAPGPRCYLGLLAGKCLTVYA